MCRTSRKSGFTLVELLVVIGIIAVLIAILLPALNKAREQAKLIACASQERQIFQYFSLYASDNHNYYPALTGYHYWTQSNGSPIELPGDFDQYGDCQEVMQTYQQGTYVGSFDSSGTYHYGSNLRHQQIWLCPSDLDPNHSLSNGDLRQTSYFPNRMAWEGALAGAALPLPNPAGQNNNPVDCRAIKPDRIHSKVIPNGKANIIMVAEGMGIGWIFYQNAPWQSSYLVTSGRTTALYDNLLFRHYNDYSMMNTLYFDGHVEPVNYKQCQTAFISMLTWPNPYN